MIRIALRTDGALGGFPWKKRRSLASPIHQSQTTLATFILILDHNIPTPNNFSEYSLFFKMLFHVCSPHRPISHRLSSSRSSSSSIPTSDDYFSLTNILHLPSPSLSCPSALYPIYYISFTAFTLTNHTRYLSFSVGHRII